MDVQQGNEGKPWIISGDFYCSQQKPVSDTASNNNNDTAKEKKFSRIPSRCQLNCEGSLFIYALSMTIPFLILPKIRKVSRQKHDKEFFCLEYGTETDRFNIFLTITNKRIADDWEYELCKLTEQTPRSRPRLRTESRPIRPNKNYTLSSPSVPQGFSSAEQDGGDVPPTNDDATDETNSEEHEDYTIPTCSNDSQPEPEDTHAPETSTMSPVDDQEETDDTLTRLTLQTQRNSRRDGQRSPRESHLGDVMGYETVSPNPPNSPNSGLIDEIFNKACTDSVLERTILKLKELQQQEQQHQHETNDDRSSEILPLATRDQPPSDSVLSRPGALRSPGPVYQCTHIEIECSQEKSILIINKKDFLSTGEINDMFVCYEESVYLKSCPEILQSQLFQGTRFLQVNKQELVGDDKAHKAIDYIKSSAGQTVNLLVQLFPLGVRVRLCVPSEAALGITLHGNEINDMHEDGVMSRIADGLRCVCPALSSTDMPSSSAEQRSITAIGDRHVPFNATSEVVKYMLDSAIKSGNGNLVLHLQPTEFCQAIAHNALQRCIEEDPDALLNPRPHRRPSLVQSLMSNPPS